MKTRFTFIFTALCTAIHAAPILPGDKLGLEFGPAANATLYWNNFAANGTKTTGSIMRTNGSVADGVSVTLGGASGFNGDGTNDWTGLQSNPADISPNPKAPPEFVNSVTTDIAYAVGTLTITLNGLNPHLNFRISAVSSAILTSTDTITITGADTYGPSSISRPTTVSQGLFHDFPAVTPNSDGAVTLTVTNSANNPVINGILIEATGPTAGGLEDNDEDGMPNWWEAAYSLDPEDAGDSDEDPDEDGFSNLDEFLAETDPRNSLSYPGSISSWAKNGDGSWQEAANWEPTGVPDGIGKSVMLDESPFTSAGFAQIYADAPVTLGGLMMEGSKPYVIIGGPLTFSTSSGSAILSATSSMDHALELAGDMILSSSLDVAVNGPTTILIHGDLSAEASETSPDLKKTGIGNLHIIGSISDFSGNLEILGGKFTLEQSGDFELPNLLAGAGAFVHSGGGVLHLSNATNSHSGGTQITDGGTLQASSVGALGTGPLTLNGGTLLAMENLDLTGRSITIGSDGATIDVPGEETTVTSGGFPASGGTMDKTGSGTWRLSGGPNGTVGLITVHDGLLDLSASDRFGNHTNSQQNLEIRTGAKVTNGAGLNGFNTFNNVTLKGGTLAVTNELSAISGAFQAYHIKSQITASGTEPSFITDEINGSNGAINIGGTTGVAGGFGSSIHIEVHDVTGNSEPDLTISAKLKNSVTTSNPYPALRSGLIKSGEGTLLLTRANTYTGNTEIWEGTLIIREPYLANDATVLIVEGGFLHLDFTGENRIDQLHLEFEAMLPGVYGAEGSGAEFETPFITGTGTLKVLSGPNAGENAFEDWIAQNHPDLEAPDNAPGADPDGDGLNNFGEFAFGGNPASGADTGAQRHGIEAIAGNEHLTLTLALREGAVFTGSGPLTGEIDGILYSIRASTNLADFTLGLEEVTPPITTGLPGNPPAGSEYRTFRLTGSLQDHPRAFIQAAAEPAAP